MREWYRRQQGQQLEGWAFTFCKAAFLVLIFRKYALLALSGLAMVFYVLAAGRGVTQWRCWAKPPWVTLFWAGVFAWQVWIWSSGKTKLLSPRHRSITSPPLLPGTPPRLSVRRHDKLPPD